MRALILATCLATGCVIAKIPDGPTIIALGQAEAVYCPVPVPEESREQGCITVRGGSLSDGAVEVVKTLFSIPGAMMRGVGNALP